MKDIVIDSNVIIRAFVKNVESQLQESKELIKQIENGKKRGLISILVINEIIWISENYYDLKRELYLPELIKLLALKNIKIIEVKKQVLVKVLQDMLRYKFDFTDIYLFSISKNREIFSFDKDLQKLAKN